MFDTKYFVDKPCMPTDNNMNVAKTPIFQRFYEKCSLVVRIPKKIYLYINLQVF